MRKLVSLFTFIIVLIFSFPSFAERIIPQEFKDKLKMFTEKAEQGDPQAMMALGGIYSDGFFEPNYEVARKWYTKAAELGDKNNKNYVAFNYLYGSIWAPQDIKKAIELYTASAAQESWYAKCFLGGIYEGSQFKENGIKPDYKKALEIYTTGGISDQPCAQVGLASMYYKGEGVKQDYKKAFELFSQANAKSDSGPQATKYYLGLMYYYGQGVSQDYDKSYDMFNEALNANICCSDGNALAQYYIAQMYYNGQSVQQDYSKAYVLAKLSQRVGSPGTYEGYRYGSLSQPEKPSDADTNKLITDIEKKISPEKLKEAQEEFDRKTGKIRPNQLLTSKPADDSGEGRAEQKSTTESNISLITKEAESGNAKAQHYLGLMYYQGKGVEKDDEKAFEWFGKAAEQNYSDSLTMLYELGFLFINGGKGDYKNTIKWLTKSASHGHLDSQRGLAMLYSNDNALIYDPYESYVWTLIYRAGQELKNPVRKVDIPKNEEAKKSLRAHYAKFITDDLDKAEAEAKDRLKKIKAGEKLNIVVRISPNQIKRDAEIKAWKDLYAANRLKFDQIKRDTDKIERLNKGLLCVWEYSGVTKKIPAAFPFTFPAPYSHLNQTAIGKACKDLKLYYITTSDTTFKICEGFESDSKAKDELVKQVLQRPGGPNVMENCANGKMSDQPNCGVPLFDELQQNLNSVTNMLFHNVLKEYNSGKYCFDILVTHPKTVGTNAGLQLNKKQK